MTKHSQSLTGFLKYLPKIMALLFQKLWRKKNLNPFPAILRRKKKYVVHKAGAGGVGPGGGLKALLDKKRRFADSLSQYGSEIDPLVPEHVQR